MPQSFVRLFLPCIFCLAAHVASGQNPAFIFDWESVAGDIDFSKPVHSSFAFTEIFGGAGAVTCLQDLPETESVAGNPPMSLEFVFGSGNSLNTGAPALSLAGFDNNGTVVVQEFTATPANALEVFNRGSKVANGVVLDVTVLTPPSLISSGSGRFQLTDDGGGDPTIFNELFALSGNTGIVSFSLANFEFSGNGFDPALFVAEGIGAPGTPPGLSPGNPLLPVGSTGGFVFNIPPFPDCVPPPIYTDPEVTIGYDFEATGTEFASLILPDIGDGSYDLLLWDGADYVIDRQITAGEEFDFAGTGVDRFRILGIEESAGLDPADPLAFVTGLTFTSTDGASMTMTPIVAPSPADFDQDGDVDGDDLIVLILNAGTQTGAGPNTGDANGDGAVRRDDFHIWQQDAGRGLGAVVAAVPEPASITLLLSLAAIVFKIPAVRAFSMKRSTSA